MKLEALTIKPLDIISIRDGRPFDVGGNHLARAIWPPSPWTVLGSIRTLLLNKFGVDLRAYGKGDPANIISNEVMEVVGPCDGPPGFCLGPVFITRNDEVPFKDHVWMEGTVPTGGGPVFPAPMDLALVFSSESKPELVRCSLKSNGDLAQKGYFTSSKFQYSLLPPDERRIEKPPSEWGLTLEGLGKYLSGEVPVWPNGFGKRKPSPESAKHEKTIGKDTRAEESPSAQPERSVISDARVGIALKDGVADEGMFYIRRGYTLAPKWSLTVPLHSKACGEKEPSDKTYSNIPDEIRNLEGTLRIGGDGHLACIEPVTLELSAAKKKEASTKENDWAVLYLPGFTNPTDLTNEALSQKVSCPVKILAAATARLQSIGGWSLVKKGPRTMKRYLPPGTVLYLECGSGPDALMKLHGRSIASDPEEAAAGFGWCLVGRI